MHFRMGWVLSWHIVLVMELNDLYVAYTSHTLAPAEKQYCQLDKEALAIIFGLKKSTNTYLAITLLFSLTTSPCHIYLILVEPF